MFMHFTIHGMKALKISDHPGDPLNRRIELYQTWHLAALETVDRDSKATWARQGFSTRGAPDDGTSFGNGDTRIVTDPQITFGLGEEVFKDGAKTAFRLDYHHWESDDSEATQKVRAAFSDATLDYMVKVWKEAEGNRRQAQAKLEEFIRGNWQSTLRKSLSVAGAAAPWVQIGLDLMPALELLVDVLRNQGDDYYDRHRFIIQINGKGEERNVQWRVIPPNGVEPPWTTGHGKQDFGVSVHDARDANRIDVRYVFRMIE